MRFAIFVVILLTAPMSLCAQWKLVATLPSPCDCGFFYDESTGFVGTGIRNNFNYPAQIFHTSDGGATWRQMSTPDIYGAVTSIQMLGPNNGFASIYADGSQTMWSTMDGGLSWTDVSPASGVGTCVYVTPAATTMTEWQANGGSMPNAGGSFRQIFVGGTSSNSNGIDFADNLNGAVSLGPLSTNGYYSHDGGLTWNIGDGLPESWSIYALKGTHTFFSAAEENGNTNTYQRIYRSTDGGMSWQSIYTFADIKVHFSGHIAGAGSTLYAQSAMALGMRTGLYRSNDLGLSWKPIQGPTNSRDTRFVVTGCAGNVVYAFDDKGGIFKTTNGGDGTMPSGTTTPMELAKVQSVKAGEHTLIPVYFKAPSTKFTITSYAFHLKFNGDVLTPDSLLAAGTLSEKASVKNFALSGNSGVSANITLSTPITEKSDLSIPLMNVDVRATLSDSMTTEILIDSFAMNGLTSLSVCSVPQTTFTLLPQCGDSTISQVMAKHSLIDLLGVSPNPSHGGTVNVSFNLAQPSVVSMNVVDAFGETHSHEEHLFTTGRNQFSINTSELTSGTYFLLISVPGEPPILSKLSQLR